MKDEHLVTAMYLVIVFAVIGFGLVVGLIIGSMF